MSKSKDENKFDAPLSSTTEHQILVWEVLKETINHHVNQINSSNLQVIIRELLKVNMVRGRELLTLAIIQSQRASPSTTSVYAAVVPAINSKFLVIGELMMERLISSFRMSTLDRCR